MRLPTKTEIRAERCKRSFHHFVKEAWSQVIHDPFRDNWHIEHVCRHLQHLSKGDIRKLAINQPPGSSKSVLVSIFFNAWQWIQDPSEAFLYASFDAQLTHRDAGHVQTLMGSEWFRDHFGHILRINPNEATGEFNTYLPGTNSVWLPAGGWRFSTSVEGKATGRHPSIRVIDDPTKPLEATGENLAKAQRWYESTLRSRARNQATVKTILIMQRLAENDLAGHLLSQGDWTHVRIPLMFDGDPYSTPYGKDPRTELDETFDHGRFPQSVCVDIRKETKDEIVWSSQWQNNPNPSGGLLFAPFCFTRRFRAPPEQGLWFQSWDCAFKGEAKSDYVVGGVFVWLRPDLYLVHVDRARRDFNSTCQAILDVSVAYPMAVIKLIEDKANGTAIMNALESKVPGLVAINPGSDSKIARARAARSYFGIDTVTPSGARIKQDPNFLLPEEAPWVQDYTQEMIKFPRGANDDQVDMTSQACNWITATGGADYGSVDWDRLGSILARS